MNNNKRIGKIKSVSVGKGGYDGAMFGISFDLGSEKESWGVGDFWGVWGTGISVSQYTKWTEDERQRDLAAAFWRLATLMKDASASEISDLKGKPIEVTFEGNVLKGWRILTEAI